MQPATTLYSGVHADVLLKFCSDECKGLWFHTPDHKPFHVASYLDEASQSSQLPLMTVVIAKDKRVEQIYLSVGRVSEGLKEMPYIVWHIRELKKHFFAHFYISEDCFPLNEVWSQQICTAEIEEIHSLVASSGSEIKYHIQMYLNKAVKIYGYDGIHSFIDKYMEGSGSNPQSGKILIFMQNTICPLRDINCIISLHSNINHGTGCNKEAKSSKLLTTRIYRLSSRNWVCSRLTQTSHRPRRFTSLCGGG